MTSCFLLTGLITLIFPTVLWASSSSDEEPWHDRRVPSPFPCKENERAELAFSFEEDNDAMKLAKFIEPLDPDEEVNRNDMDKKRAAANLKRSFHKN